MPHAICNDIVNNLKQLLRRKFNRDQQVALCQGTCNHPDWKFVIGNVVHETNALYLLQVQVFERHLVPVLKDGGRVRLQDLGLQLLMMGFELNLSSFDPHYAKTMQEVLSLLRFLDLSHLLVKMLVFHVQNLHIWVGNLFALHNLLGVYLLNVFVLSVDLIRNGHESLLRVVVSLTELLLILLKLLAAQHKAFQIIGFLGNGEVIGARSAVLDGFK